MDSGVGSNKKMPPHDTAKQVEEITKVKIALEKGEKNSMGKVRKSYLDAFIELNHVRVTKKKPTKKDMVDALARWVRYQVDSTNPVLTRVQREANQTSDIAIPNPLPYPIYNFPLPGHREVVLNAAVLAEVVNDVKKTTLPNWIAGPPQNLGSRKQGKLSADQWRSLCTISLVVTLIRLWSGGGEFSTSKRWLDNFLDLVVAIRYATKRSTTPESIAIVEEQVDRYLRGLVELFGVEALTLNHHLSLHLPDFLRRLGPVHGWWTFAFERYNGIIQRFNTNNKFGTYQVPIRLAAAAADGYTGELEATFMRTFCRGGNLRSTIADLPEIGADAQMQSIVNTLRTSFDHSFSTQFKGTLKADLLALGADGKVETQDRWVVDQEEYLLPAEIYTMLSSRIQTLSAYATHNQHSQLIRRVKVRGIEYTSKRESKGNSQVVFRTKGQGGMLIEAAGQIDTIFRHRYCEALTAKEVVKTYFAVRRYCELEDGDALQDPYRWYPRLDVRLCYSRFEPQPYIIEKDEIISHLATCPVHAQGKDFTVVMNLDRVRIRERSCDTC